MNSLRRIVVTAVGPLLFVAFGFQAAAGQAPDTTGASLHASLGLWAGAVTDRFEAKLPASPQVAVRAEGTEGGPPGSRGRRLGVAAGFGRSRGNAFRDWRMVEGGEAERR